MLACTVCTNAFCKLTTLIMLSVSWSREKDEHATENFEMVELGCSTQARIQTSHTNQYACIYNIYYMWYQFATLIVLSCACFIILFRLRALLWWTSNPGLMTSINTLRRTENLDGRPTILLAESLKNISWTWARLNHVSKDITSVIHLSWPPSSSHLLQLMDGTQNDSFERRLLFQKLLYWCPN